MKEFIKTIDNLPFALKLLFCIPALDIIWAIYRIIKGYSTNNTLLMIIGVLWIVPGVTIGWIIDIVTTLLNGKPVLTD